MWGYFKNNNIDIDVNLLELSELLSVIQKLAYKEKVKYLIESTALSDLKIWI